MKTGEWTLRSRRVVTPTGTRAADVVIRRETIAAVAAYEDPETEGVILDVDDLLVLPGLVAIHLEGPRFADWVGYESATRDAGAGGVTTLVDLPTDAPPTSDTLSAFTSRKTSAAGKLRVDCGLVVGLGHGNSQMVETWIEAGVIGIEAFLGPARPGGFPSSTESDLRAAMPKLAKLARPLLVHLGRFPGPSTDRPDDFSSSLPEPGFDAMRMVIRICRESRCRVHFIHPTAIEALPMIAEARAEGLPVTVETCPRHLSFAPEAIVKGASSSPFQTIRPGSDLGERLWEGLRSGLIDAIGTDHSRTFAKAPRSDPGASGPSRRDQDPTWSVLSAVWDEAGRRGCTADDVARWMANKPAAVFGLSNRKGSIAAGFDADLIVFDPRAGSAAGPKVEATILRGTLIYQGGRFHENPRGSVVLRLEETLPMPGTKS